jgi:Holliday junction DNA helicase RuvA
VISQIRGTLITRELDRVEVLTSGGVAYELSVPLGVLESLPRVGEPVTLYTSLVIREEQWQLFGFAQPFERRVFRRLLDAKGIGPALALNMLSALNAERLVRAIREKDVATLQGVPRVGRKKAEQLILDLADKVDELLADAGPGQSAPGGTTAASADAVRALVSLGYAQSDAERAVHAALQGTTGTLSATDLVRAALSKIREQR